LRFRKHQRQLYIGRGWGSQRPGGAAVFNNPRKRREQVEDDEVAAAADALEHGDREPPLEVKRTPRLRSTKPERDSTD
jgi:hypothetical protein